MAKEIYTTPRVWRLRLAPGVRELLQEGHAARQERDEARAEVERWMREAQMHMEERKREIEYGERLRAEVERLRALLRLARGYVRRYRQRENDAVPLLARIDAALRAEGGEGEA